MPFALLTIIACFCAFDCILHVAAADPLASAELLPNDFFALGDYEVLSVHEDGDEDVVRIRKRAGDEECESDCMGYSGWTEDGRMQCNDENETSEDWDDESMTGLELLLKRGKKGKL